VSTAHATSNTQGIKARLANAPSRFRDFYLACFLRCTGYELLDLRDEGRRKVFVFQDLPTRRDDAMAFYGEQSRSLSTSLVNRRHRRLSRPIPIRAFAVGANLWFLVPFPRNPFVPAPFAAVSPNLHLRHRGDIFSGGIYVKYVRYGC